MTDSVIEDIDFLECMDSLSVDYHGDELTFVVGYDLSEIEASTHAVAGEIDGELARMGEDHRGKVRCYPAGDDLVVRTEYDFSDIQNGEVAVSHIVASNMIHMAYSADNEAGKNIVGAIAMEIQQKESEKEAEQDD